MSRAAVIEKLNMEEDFPAYLNFSGLDLSGLDLSGLNLSLANFDEANLDGANLNHTSLVRSSFRRASLVGAQLVKTMMHLTKFEYANLSRANLYRANVGAIMLSITDGVASVEPAKINFWGADCTWTNFQNSQITGSYFFLANLTKANLGNTSLVGTLFGGTVLSDTDFFQANLSNARLNLSVNMNSWKSERYTEIPSWCELKPSVEPHQIVLTVVDNVDFRSAQYNRDTYWGSVDPKTAGAILI